NTPERWLLAYDSAGGLVGLVVPQRLDGTHGTINYIGVVPERRGEGCVDDLVREGLRRLAPLGLTKFLADTDARNAPMASAFERAGLTTDETVWVYEAKLD